MKRVLLLALAVFLVACTEDPAPERTEAPRADEIVIGSFDFTENQILSEIYASVLEENEYPVRRLSNVASREIMAPAMDQAFVDFVVEYQGTALTFVELRDTPLELSRRATYERLRSELDEREAFAFKPAPVESKNEVVVTAQTAAEYDLVTISDLRPIDFEFVFGGPPECPSRPLCLAGLQSTYELAFHSFQPLDAGGPLTAAALRSGEIDAGILFTTSPALVGGDLVVLEDDRSLQPPDNVVPIARSDVIARYGPDFVRLVNSVSARLTTLDVRSLNQRVDLGGEDPAAVAREWVIAEGLIE